VRTDTSGYTSCYDGVSSPNYHSFNATPSPLSLSVSTPSLNYSNFNIPVNPVLLSDSLICTSANPVETRFHGSDTTICTNTCISFYNDSTLMHNGYAFASMNFQWLFPGATFAAGTDTLENPTNVCYANPGQYDVTLIVTKGCKTDTLIKPNYITVYPNPTVSVIGDTNVCIGGSSNLSATSTANSYLWTPNTGLSNDTTATVTATPANNTTYTVTVTDTIGCQNTDSITVTIDTTCIAPHASFAASSTNICQGSSITFTDNSTGSGIVSWNWSFNGGTPSSSTTQGPHTVVFTNAGTFNITLQVADSSSTDDTTLVIVVNPTATFTQNFTGCQGFSVTVGANTYNTTGVFVDTLATSNGCDSIVTTNLSINSAATGTDVISSCVPITWIDGNNYVASTNTPTDTIFGGAANGCDSIVTLNLTINSAATGIDVQTACGSFTWIDGNTYTSSTNTPTDTIFGGSWQGCDSIVTLNLTITIPNTTTNVYNECEGFSVTVGSNTYTTTGIFTDIVNNCDTIITDLTINPNPIINLTNNLTINQGSSVTLSASGGGTYLWSPSTYLSCDTCAATIVSPLFSTNYCVDVTAPNGCTDTKCVDVNVDVQCGELFVPNVFSPNGDGNNDVLKVKINPTCVTSFNIKIFDRWGEKVFESDDINNSWDGTYKGKPLNSAVFVYHLAISLINSEISLTKKGSVSIIK